MRLPVALGLNVMLNVQLAPTAIFGLLQAVSVSAGTTPRMRVARPTGPAFERCAMTGTKR